MPASNPNVFIPSSKKDPKEMNNALSDFLAGNPMDITDIKKSIKPSAPAGRKFGWIITFEP